MRLSLVVADGAHKGKVIPITIPQFLIGRDPQCHLRPASTVISKRHCAITIQSGRAFVQDFGSTNGTFVNDKQIKQETELLQGDRVKIGPLLFVVRIQVADPSKQTPVPGSKKQAVDDEAAAAMLLELSNDEDESAIPEVGDQVLDDVPMGSTVMDAPAIKQNPAATQVDQPAKSPGNTSNAAKAILEKYTRRPRG